VRACLEPAAEAAAAGIASLRSAGEAPQPIVAAYRAMRNYAQAAQAIYPMAAFLRPVSQFFLEQSARDDAALLTRLAAVDPAREKVGVMHAGGPPGTRGAFSLYVPETYDESSAYPLVVALHGGSGNGGAFLWSWLREARTRGCILISPTSQEGTWSLMNPPLDGDALRALVGRVAERWSIDTDRVLLTGMSDGGTFSLLTGLIERGPFTHLAPISGSFHPMLLDGANGIRGLPIYLVHGVLDWMFPIDMARTAHAALAAAGAAVTFREIPDLSHTYPRDENPRILDWLLGS
jgi:phospholipase/carboxylesterase